MTWAKHSDGMASLKDLVVLSKELSTKPSVKPA